MPEIVVAVMPVVRLMEQTGIFFSNELKAKIQKLSDE